MPSWSRLRRMLTAALAVAALIGPAAAAKEWTTIRIGAEAAYPPFSFFGPDRTLQGFEIDLARAICENRKVRCEFVAQDWESLIPGLLAGKFDVIFASMSITDDRRKLIDFSDRYYATPSLFVTSKSNAAMGVTPEALSGKRLGAQGSTVSARYLKERYGPAGAQLKLYATQDEANLDLAAGRLDAVLADKVALLTWLEKENDGGCCQMIGPDIADPAYFGAGIGAGMRKGDTELKALIDAGIAAVRRDGTYGRINARYFPFDIY